MNIRNSRNQNTNFTKYKSENQIWGLAKWLYKDII